MASAPCSSDHLDRYVLMVRLRAAAKSPFVRTTSFFGSFTCSGFTWVPSSLASAGCTKNRFSRCCVAWYPSYVAKALPKRLSPRVKAQAARGGVGRDFDPLFRLNHNCAVIRSDLACMARRTWATTKKRGRLQDRLDLFIAVHNGYAFG
jgi:hypothetical protein